MKRRGKRWRIWGIALLATSVIWWLYFGIGLFFKLLGETLGEPLPLFEIYWFFGLIGGIQTGIGVFCIMRSRKLKAAEEGVSEFTEAARLAKHKNGIRTAGGILTITGGCFGIGLGAVLAIIPTGDFADSYGFFWEFFLESFWLFIGGVLIAIGIVALIGGIFALKRRCWRFALAGAILASICGVPAGILGTIFIALRKGEFE